MRPIRFLSTVALAVALIFSAPARAAVPAQQITLLVSLDPALFPSGVAAFFNDYKDYPAKVEANFRKKFASTGYVLNVVQNANRADLYQALHSPDNVAVFWVSHAAPVDFTKDPGIEINPLLVDHNRADVKEIFREINPGIRWVSLVACDSNMVINWLKSGGFSDTAVQLQGFSKEIDAIQGLDQSLTLAQTALSKPAASVTCASAQGVPITLSRELDAKNGANFFPAVSIENQGQVVGVFPEANLKPGNSLSQTQTIYLTLPTTGAAATDLNLVIQSGFDPAVVPNGFALGQFSVSGQWYQAQWTPFAKADGTPFGTTELLLNFSGYWDTYLPEALPTQNFQPFTCGAAADPSLAPKPVIAKLQPRTDSDSDSDLDY